MDHVNEACEVRHMSVGGLPRCVALMVVLAWMLWPYAPRGRALLPGLFEGAASRAKDRCR